MIAAMLVGAPLRGYSAGPDWEIVQQYSVPADSGDEQAERLDVTVRGGYLYVTVTRPVTVRLFTILGNLVSQRNLPAGTSRLRLKGRGMYLLKTDRGTRRVTF